MGPSIFPTRNRPANPNQESRVVPFEDAHGMIEALGSPTARDIVDTLGDAPMPPSDLAEATGTSLQNVLYHLENLAEAEFVEVVDTEYSSRGLEMDVYALASESIVICLGDEEDELAVSRAVESGEEATPEPVGSD